jgi:hypothetical protein
VAELTKLGSAAYDKVAADSNATDADYVAANKAFFESSQAKFDEMVQVVPTEIKADVQTVVDSIRGQAGLGAEVPTDDTTAAEERVKTYEDAHC